MSQFFGRGRLVAVAAILLITLALAACQGAPMPSASAPGATTAAAAAASTEAATTEAAAAATEPAAATEAPAAATEAAASATQGASAARHFQIVPDGTEARFVITEVLMGQDKTVVGKTAGVTGEITVDPATPASAQIGEIRVDASSLKTDDDRRNRQLRNNILKSGTAQYQYVVFKPTGITGMPESVTVGTPITFQVTGDLTILDKTAPVTFDMTVTPESTDVLKGSGKATVRYADFGISIPNVPFVANVGDNVQLELDFTAQASA